MTPQRVQRQRTKGWRKPEGAVYVGRGSRWGNPYRLHHGPGHEAADAAEAVRRYRRWLTDPLKAGHMGLHVHSNLPSYQGVPYRTRPSIEEIREALAGCDLLCWCPLDRPCHADVLLEIANSEG